MSVAAAFSSCATLFSTREAPVIMVDAPRDLSVKDDGLSLSLKRLVSSSFEGSSTKTTFYAPGVGLDKKVKYHKLTLTSGGVSKDIDVKLRASAGFIFLDLFFTGPIGIAVDASTKKWRKAAKRHIDVPAVLNGTKSRSQGQLKRAVRRSARKG